MTNAYLRAVKKHPTLKAHAKERLEKRKGQGKPDQPGKPEKPAKPGKKP